MTKRSLFLIFGIGLVFFVFGLAISHFCLRQDDYSAQKSAQGIPSVQEPDALTQEEKIIREELDKITDPEFNAPLTKFISINSIEIDDGKVTIEINLPPWCPYKEKIIALIKEQISRVKNVKSVEVMLKEWKERTPKGEKEISSQSCKKKCKKIFNNSESLKDSKNSHPGLILQALRGVSTLLRNLEDFLSGLLVPKITDVSVRPTDVVPGDMMIVTASVSDSFGISSVTADMGGIETINLSLMEGSVYQGAWKNKWKVHDTEVKGYITTIFATNNLGLSSSSNVGWTDAAPWWNYDYHYRKQITVTNNTASTLSAGYTVWITENTAALVTVNQMQDDGDDLRIVYWNGISNVELDRHLRYMNTTSTEAYFRTQADIGGSGADSDYYMYYDYSDAVNPPANGTNIYEFWEPFNNLTAWTTLAGTPSVSGGIVTLSPYCEIHHDMGYLGNVYNKVFEIYAYFDVSTGTRSWVGVQMTEPWTDWYCGNQCCDDNYNGYRDLILIDSVVNDVAQTMVTATAHDGSAADDQRSAGWNPGANFHVYTAKWKQNEVKFFKDGVAWWTSTRDVASWDNVYLQLWAYANNDLKADWYAVRKYVDPEPSTSLGDPTLVELSYFNARPFYSAVLLEWATETELDNEGFNILRSHEEEGECVKINPYLIPARGQAGLGAEYSYTDYDVENGVTYYYLLEDVDFYGKSTLHGPVSATPNDIILIWPIDWEPLDSGASLFSWASSGNFSFKVDVSKNPSFSDSETLSFPEEGWTSSISLWLRPEELEMILSKARESGGHLFWRIRAKSQDDRVFCSYWKRIIVENNRLPEK
jgi:metal-sulfur cluster biosynthetic enzyme